MTNIPQKKVRWGVLSTAAIGLRKVIPGMQGSRRCSIDAIAGVYSRNLRVLGLMPHPEDLVDPLMGGTDGKPLFDSIAAG